jgi:hypothetical protein
VIFLDGMRLEDQAAIDWLDMYAPEQVAAVEVYGHESEIPPLFNGWRPSRRTAGPRGGR